MSDADLQRQFETVWSEIRLLLEWRQGFAFYLVFGDDSRVSARLRQRLNDYVSSRTGLLQWLRPDRVENAVEEVLAAVFPSSAEFKPFLDRQAPIWIELTVGPGISAWDVSRRKTLSALNQRRSALETTCPRALFLQLPLAMASEVVTWAPDLWSVREYIALLPLEAPDYTLVAPAELRRMSISLDDVGASELEQGRLASASTAYRESLELTRQLRAALGDTPQALRDLSVSLDKVGDVARDGGRQAEALAAYRESLDLRRQLRAALGDTPQALRDLSVSLNKVGHVTRDCGRQDEALAAYRESLGLRRQLRAALGDTPQALRDLSVSLDNVGNVARDSGQLAEALAAFRESLELSRQLRATLGDTPQALRDLSVSLNNVGDVARDSGRLAEALAAYRETTELKRQLEVHENQLLNAPGQH